MSDLWRDICHFDSPDCQRENRSYVTLFRVYWWNVEGVGLMPLRIKDVSLFTVRDVAYRLGIAEGTVRKYLRDGKMIGRKYAGAWHITEESFRHYLNEKGDELGEEDIPQIVIQVPVQQDETGNEFEIDDEELLSETSVESDLDEPFPRPAPEGIDELQWLIQEAQRLKERARRLEARYGSMNEHQQ